MKKFDRKAVISYLLIAGLAGLFYFLVYQPLLTWSPVIPPVYVEVADTVYFDINSTEIKPWAYPVLAHIASSNAGKIIVTGGADSTGNATDNWKLAQDRSKTVRAMLIDMGISRDSILAIGFGDRRPIGRIVENNRYTIIKWKLVLHR